MGKKIQTTLHISEQVRDRFKKIVAAQGGEMSAVIEDIMEDWARLHSANPRTEKVQLDSAAKFLVEAVIEHLGQNHDWAKEALIRAGMGLPGETVFDRRIGHFSLEKQQLGARLARWLLYRAINRLKQNTKVFLVCDSGTTVFWFLKALGEAITSYFQGHPDEKGEVLENLAIITNNIPGAESYVTYASHHNLQGKTRISDIVECRLLAGTLLPEYVAVTGDDTNLDLENISKKNRDKQPNGNHASSTFIGVTTGNWITIKQHENVALPHLLARGKNHGKFKSKLLKVCDEIFVLAPLGKNLLLSVDDLNAELRYSAHAADPQEKSYELVPMPDGKSKRIKLVSTFRKGDSIFSMHSALVRKEIGEYSELLDQPDEKALLPIEEVRHLMFPFDEFSGKPVEEQIEMELPHERTRSEEFKRNVYSIQL